jgi:hypothetical protein
MEQTNVATAKEQRVSEAVKHG